jgi:uncharacterized membrane protein YhaH (DUF805 family)
MSLGQLLFSFRGRLNRKPYWLTSVCILVILVLLVIYAVVMFGQQDFRAAGLTIALLFALYIPLIWISLALGAKRLHDRDKSAWWLLLFYLVPSLLEGAANQTDSAGIILHLAGFAITVWAFVELSCLRGTIGPNRYGPDPLSPPVPAGGYSPGPAH